MDLEFWKNYFLEEIKKDSLYESTPLILEFSCIEDYLKSLGLSEDEKLNSLKEIDYPSWLFLNALHEAEIQATLDSLVEQGYVYASYDSEHNDMVYSINESIVLD